MVSINSNYHKNLNINQDSLFSDDKLFEIQVDSDGYDFWDKEFKLEKEMEVIGFYLSEHPTKNLKKFFKIIELIIFLIFSNLKINYYKTVPLLL